MHHPLQPILLLGLALAGNLGSTGPSQDLCAQYSHLGDNLWGKGVCREEIGSLTNFLPLTTVTTSPAPGPIATASPNTLQGFHIVSHQRPPACSGAVTSLSAALRGYGPFGQGLVPHALRGIVLGFEGLVLHALRGIVLGFEGLVPHALRGIVLGFEGLVPHALRGIVLGFGQGLVPSPRRGKELGFGQGLAPALRGDILGFEQCGLPVLQGHSIRQQYLLTRGHKILVISQHMVDYRILYGPQSGTDPWLDKSRIITGGVLLPPRLFRFGEAP
ncbi:hypothetical protein C8F04DRAFT_1200561 [Mycena alexandri]|uniref:Uncharacterized protein n=1 Tax=Mycena alexandri TaxID=1745969 RepID=A0AAD6RYY3_9AGAR|nr:hypothetical protein C8F04DRAFT_1200561 [Mycena alexandri]